MSAKVIVIGSGFGGLAAAVRLRAMGHDVLVLEARDQPGGRAGVFHQDGYTFDAGPTVITAPYLLDELFEILGRSMEGRVDLTPVDPFYRIEFNDGSRFDYSGDEQRLTDQIRAFHPPDVENYRRLLGRIRSIFDVGYTQLADVPFERLRDMLRIIPEMVGLGSFRSVYSLVASYIEDERIRQVLTFQPLLIGGNPFRTTSIYTLIHWLERKWGVHFARGGTTSIVRALVELLAEVGVEVRLNAPVDEIEIQGGQVRGVRLAGGERIPARFVVCNADPSVVYTKLIDPRWLSKNRPARIGRKRQSMSLLVGYFGTRRTYPELAHHTIVLGPRYRGLLEDIFEEKVLAPDFSLYLHAPTRTDPSLAPPGHEAFYVLSPVPNNLSGIDWQERGAEYFDRILAGLEDRVLPGLRANITTRFHVTPDYFERDLRSMHGAAFGLEPVLTQSAWFRYHNRSEDVPGLYFVGASTHPGAGVPGVLSTAKVLERVVPRPDPEHHRPVPPKKRPRPDLRERLAP